MSLVPDYDENTLDHVPTLRELMPSTAGLPGVLYGLVVVSNQRAAQDDGWGAVTNARVLTLKGPKGHCDVILACQGSPIPGMDTNSGARKLYLDEDIYHLSGLWLGKLPEHLAEQPQQPQEPTKSKSKTTSSEYDGLPSNG